MPWEEIAEKLGAVLEDEAAVILQDAAATSYFAVRFAVGSTVRKRR